MILLGMSGSLQILVMGEFLADVAGPDLLSFPTKRFAVTLGVCGTNILRPYLHADPIWPWPWLHPRATTFEPFQGQMHANKEDLVSKEHFVFTFHPLL